LWEHDGRRVRLESMKKALAILALVPLATLVLACGDSAEADPDPTSTPSAVSRSPTSTSGSGSPQAPSIVAPPAATASTGGSSQRMGTGSYCWGAVGATAVCIDKQGVITNSQPLAVSSGTQISVQTGLQQAQIQEVTVTAGVPAGQPTSLSATEQSWQPPSQTQRLQGIVNAAGIQFRATLNPGRYVVTVFVRAAQGDVSYGLLLQVN
jgi:hypothetical protein